MWIQLFGLAANLLIKSGLFLITSSSILIVNTNDILLDNHHNNWKINFISAISDSHLIAQNMVNANLGEQFQLQPGQSASINSGEVEVTFLKVIEDSRCPSDLTCFWAGEIQVAVNILVKDHELETLNLINNASRQDLSILKINQYLVEFVKAEPYPQSNQEINISDYIITLAVAKATDD